MMYRYEILGRPITKKNSMVKTRFGLIQSKQYRAYESDALDQLMTQKRPEKPIDCACYMRCKYYMPDRRGWPDIFGLLQATADILQKAGIVEDDGFIAFTDQSYVAGIDKEKPRVSIEIGEITDLDFPYYKVHPKLAKRAKNGQFERLKAIKSRRLGYPWL